MRKRYLKETLRVLGRADDLWTEGKPSVIKIELDPEEGNTWADVSNEMQITKDGKLIIKFIDLFFRATCPKTGKIIEVNSHLTVKVPWDDWRIINGE